MKRTSRKGAIALLCFPFVLIAQTTETRRLIGTGARISSADAAKHEKSLESNPGDLRRRIVLLGHYFAAELRAGVDPAQVRERARHLRWIVEHRPDSDVWESGAAMLNGPDEPEYNEAYGSVKSLWLRQLQANPSTDSIHLNAARFLAVADRALARDTVQARLQRKPKHRDAQFLLGTLDALSMLDVTRTIPAGLPEYVSGGHAQSTEGKAAYLSVLQATDTRRVCGASVALMRYGSVLAGAPSLGFDLVGMASALSKRGLELNQNDIDCQKSADRAVVWTGLRRSGWLTPATQGDLVLVDGRLAREWRLNEGVPAYPEAAKMRRVQGDVVVVIIVGTDGSVLRAEAVAGPPELRSGTLEFVKNSRYQPLVIRGTPIVYVTDVVVDFRMVS